LTAIPTLARLSSRLTPASAPRELRIALDLPLPSEIHVGAGTALFVAGTCFCPEADLAELELLVDGTDQPVLAAGMPRLDHFAELHPQLDPLATAGPARDEASPADPGLRAYASGFWALARIAPGASGPLRLALRARLRDGEFITAPLATIQRLGAVAEPAPAPVHARGDGDLVAICMATYNPPPALFRRQLASIRAQTHANWVCVISDDCSDAGGAALIAEETSDDDRFLVSRSPRRLGFYRNFERALALAPRAARYVAMADQDDAWRPEKLAALLDGLDDAQLVYSDARIVTPAGEVLSETYWSRRRNNHSDLLSLLVANSVTGAASLMRREVLDAALPFPPAQFAYFHDHWVALVALSLGRIAFVDRPLYDYIQHGQASLGHAAANRMAGLRERLRAQRDPRERVRMWRLHYFVDVCRLLTLVAILELRCGATMSRAKRRALRRFTSADSSLTALLALGARGLRDMHGTPQTLGAEWMLFHAFLWRRLLSASARQRPQRRLRLDAVPPSSLALRPTRVRAPGPAVAIADKLAPLELAIDPREPQRINLLIPTVDLHHLFGGYIAKFNLAQRLAEQGQRVRLVTVDPVGNLPRDYQRQVESYAGLHKLFETVEIAFGRGPSPLPLGPTDRFIATTWWTAHIAARADRELGNERFVYLIQEYEPFTFPMGSYAALARGSYAFPHFALFSTELLRDYFRRHQIGVYAAGAEAGDRDSLSFQNAITEVAAPAAALLAARRSRRLLFYARPEPHAARNMFELGLLALEHALDRGAFDGGWELRGIGTTGHGRELALGAGTTVELLPRSGQNRYAGLLREHDVGLALMDTPHPSLVPIEMAAAGLLTVTNSFENKTPAAMAAISNNLIIAPPTVEGIADGLLAACAAVGDYERRVAGSAVAWSRSWAESFDAERLATVLSALRN
jgi:glycosyltransferase involved in cell wall biosynthesis